MAEALKGTKAHTRYYSENGALLPGVTTITGMMDKPALVVWANRLGLEGYDCTKYRDKAAEIGTCAHLRILHYFKGTEPDLSEFSADVIDKSDNSMIKFYEWLKDFEIEPMHVEQPFISEKYKYGGTIDFYGLLNGRPCLLDFKTSKGIYEEMIMQVAAYYRLLRENKLDVKGASILRIGRDESEGFEYRVIDIGYLNKHWLMFKHLLSIYYLRKSL